MSTEHLRTIGEALTFWRESAESMERQRNEAFQQVAAAESLAAALRSDVQDLTAERDRLRAAVNAFTEHHDNGQAGQPGFPRTYDETDIWQAEWDRRYEAMRAVLASAGEQSAISSPNGVLAAECSEGRHIVLPSGEACVCGDNRTEPLL